MKIKIDHIQKIEGHATFGAKLKNGDIEGARISTLEGSRLIEGILQGRDFNDAPLITSRICGICPVVHNLTAIAALEQALKITVPDDVILLRKIMELAQVVHSHALHVYFMSLPDYIGIDSALNLFQKNPSAAEKALALRKWGNQIIAVIGGRSIHPVNSQVGGFLKKPGKKELLKILENGNEVLEFAFELATLINRANFIKFSRPTEYVSLTEKREYPFYHGEIYSSHDGKILRDKFFKELQEEHIMGQLVKRVQFHGRIYMLGALARLNNNYRYLSPQTKAIFSSFKLKMPLTNSFQNILAQSMEIAQSVEQIQLLLREYLKLKKPKLWKNFKIRRGQGLWAMEAPRGLLFHYYELDKWGRIKNNNIVTPTAQFLNNLEADLKLYLKKQKNFNTVDKKKVNMLIRAYDPCMTCATH